MPTTSDVLAPGEVATGTATLVTGAPAATAGTSAAADRTWLRTGRRLAVGAVMVGALLGLWQVLANAEVFGAGTFPGPWGILAQLLRDRSLETENASTTLTEAMPGLLLGSAAALVVGALFVQYAWLERLLNATVIGLLCAPIIALAPIFYIVFNPYTEKLLVAAFAAFFPVLVATMTGLRSADPLMLDLVRAYGGGAIRQAVTVRFRAAFPSILSGIQIAFPAAVLGAILGEFAGGTSGLGVFMMNSLAQFNPERTWGVGLVATVLGTLGFLLLGRVQRALTRDQPLALRTSGLSDDLGGASLSRPVRFGLWLASLAIVVGGWWLALKVLNVNSYFAKGPADVWRFLFVDDGSGGEERADLFHALGHTLPASLAGAGLGLLVAYLAAVAFLWSKSLQNLLMSGAMVLQSVPLQAMTPLIVVVLGRGMVSSIVVAVLVTFFPSVVLMAAGLRDVPPAAGDVFTYLGASQLTQVRMLRTPAALPKIFAAARLGLPGSLMGVLVAEYLATGQGVGFILSNSAALSKYGKLWSAVVVITLVSVLMYALVARLERWANRVYGGAP